MATLATARFRARRLGALLLFGGALTAGCRATPAPSREAVPSTRPALAAAPVDPLRDDAVRFERIALKRFGLELALPDPKGWHPSRERSRFLELVHEATGSRLVVRRWTSSERATPELCEADARLYRDLPKGGELLADGRRELAGLDAVARTGIAVSGDGVRGYVTGFGGLGRDCLAFAFATEAKGPDAHQAVEERLAVIEQRTLLSLRRTGGLEGGDGALER